jgi:hypothetical protein
MKAFMILALGLLSSSAFAMTGSSTGGITCHQGYEYKMVRDSFGKVAFVPTGRTCTSHPRS